MKTPARPDPEIAKEVDDPMKSDRATHSASVLASVSAAKVTLRGTADSYSQRELMAEIASRVPGVQAVSLEVTISRVSSREAAEIATEVTDAFRKDGRLGGTQVAVDVHAKDAVLSGVVGSLAQRDAAVEDAWNAAVANVDASALRVDWRESEQAWSAARPPAPSDKALAAAVSRRLKSDVRVGAELPIVHVEQGAVSLSGNLVDFRAKRAAGRDARQVSGVWRVEDGMTVPPANRESDATIQQQVLRGIYDDIAAPDSRDVRVMTANGPVTLQGAVASPEDKKVIEDDVHAVPGVVAVDDDLQVRGYGPQGGRHCTGVDPASRDRGDLLGPACRNRPNHGGLSPGGDVTLHGQLDSWEEARAANDDAIRAGAASVINRIPVED
ncbi:MAG: BON domain-containing protein, partial [Polyangiaceae bacterium]